MKAPYRMLCQQMKEHGVKPRRIPKKQLVAFTCQRENGAYSVIAYVEDSLVVAAVRSPFRGQPGCFPSLAEAICRINRDLKFGRFDIDFDDGTIGCKATSFFSRSLSDEVIEAVVASTIDLMDKFLPSFLSIQYANDHPESAVKRAWANLRTE